MDPEVETYTQVPTRIIYFPGEHTPFSRQSPKQEVAYSLKPINRSPGLPAPKIDFEPAVGGDQPNTFPTGFLNKDGSVTQGEGRRLGVNEATEPGKQRAEDLLKKGEELRWSSSVGWIGFKASKTEKKIEQSGTNNTIPDLPKQAPHGKPPEIDPIGNLGSGKTEEAKKDEPEINFNKEFNPSPTK
jgi:hypothetical protein